MNHFGKNPSSRTKIMREKKEKGNQTREVATGGAAVGEQEVVKERRQKMVR